MFFWLYAIVAAARRDRCPPQLVRRRFCFCIQRGRLIAAARGVLSEHGPQGWPLWLQKKYSDTTSHSGGGRKSHIGAVYGAHRVGGEGVVAGPGADI